MNRKGEKEMTREVKFYWWKSYKVWTVKGNNILEIEAKCHELAEKYGAIHFEVLG